MNLSAVIFKRTVSWPKVTRTLAITVVSGIILTVFMFLLILTEEASLDNVMCKVIPLSQPWGYLPV